MTVKIFGIPKINQIIFKSVIFFFDRQSSIFKFHFKCKVTSKIFGTPKINRIEFSSIISFFRAIVSRVYLNFT